VLEREEPGTMAPGIAADAPVVRAATGLGEAVQVQRVWAAHKPPEGSLVPDD
jgi:hypothetical protein